MLAVGVVDISMDVEVLECLGMIDVKVKRFCLTKVRLSDEFSARCVMFMFYGGDTL